MQNKIIIFLAVVVLTLGAIAIFFSLKSSIVPSQNNNSSYQDTGLAPVTKSCGELSDLESAELAKLNLACQNEADCARYEFGCGICAHKNADISNYKNNYEKILAECDFSQPVCAMSEGCSCYNNKCVVKPKCPTDTIPQNCDTGPCCCPVGEDCS